MLSVAEFKRKIRLALVGWVILAAVCLNVLIIKADSQEDKECMQGQPRPEPTYRTFFGRQDTVRGESEKWRIELGSRASAGTCPGGYQFLFSVADKQSGASSKFVLCNQTVQVDEIDIVDPAKLLVLGRLAANAPMATIIDLPSGTVVDHFMVFMPAVSPDRHFLAFVQSFSGHPGPVSISAHYVVYDLTRGVVFNHPGASEGGWVVYPPGATNAPGSNIVPQDEPYHRWTSQELFWIENDKLLFGDIFEGQNKLIVSDLSDGIERLRIHAIDLDASGLVDLSQCRELYSRLDFENLAKEPSGIIRIAYVESLKAGWACLQFVHNPCLRYTSRPIRVP